MSESGYAIPLPVPTELTAAFWEYLKEGQLRIQRCRKCRAYQHLPWEICKKCHSFDLEWAPVSGEGTVYTYATVYRPPTPAFTPGYVIAVIELKEGVRVHTNLVECEPDEVRIGMPVKVVFEKVSDDITLFKFAPVRPAKAAK